MKIIKGLVILAGWFSKLWRGEYSVPQNPFMASDYERAKSFKKSKGGGRGIGMIAGLPKSSKYVVQPYPDTNWHRGNRSTGG